MSCLPEKMPMPCVLLCSYYGHLSQRFCNINRVYQELFEDCFRKQYSLIHRLETNKLRNVARLFAVSFCQAAWLPLHSVASFLPVHSQN